jgi:hypothetical protein
LLPLFASFSERHPSPFVNSPLLLFAENWHWNWRFGNCCLPKGLNAAIQESARHFCGFISDFRMQKQGKGKG